MPSKLESDRPPEGLKWGEGESARKPGQSPDLKGVFGEGASVVALPPSAPSVAKDKPSASVFGNEKPQNDNEAGPAKPLPANKTGLWSADAMPAAQRGTWQGVGALPRAVIGRSDTLLAAQLDDITVPAPGGANPSPNPRSSSLPPDSAARESPASVQRSLVPPATSRRAPDSATGPQSLRAVNVVKASEPPKPKSIQPLMAAEPSLKPESLPPIAPSVKPRQPLMAAEPSLPPLAQKLMAAERPSSDDAVTQPPTAAESSDHVKPTLPLESARPARPRRAIALWITICAIVMLAIAVILGGAFARLWKLPPGAATMFGLEPARTRSQEQLVIVPAQHRVPAMKPATEPATAKPTTDQAIPQADPATAKPTTDQAIPQADPATAKPDAPAPGAVEPTTQPSVPQHAAETPPPSAADNAAPAAEPSATAPETTGLFLSGDRLLLAVRSKIAAEDLDAAEAMARRGMARDPDDHHAMEALVEVLIEETRGVEAVKYAVQIVRKRPKRASYRLLEGDARMLANDRVGAERAWREALALDPTNRDAKRRLGVPQ